MKYWSGSRVEAEGRMARSEGGASPSAGCNDRATKPAALLPRAVDGCVDFDAGRPAAAGLADIALDIGTALRALANAKIHSNATPFQYFNSLLEKLPKAIRLDETGGSSVTAAWFVCP